MRTNGTSNIVEIDHRSKTMLDGFIREFKKVEAEYLYYKDNIERVTESSYEPQVFLAKSKYKTMQMLKNKIELLQYVQNLIQ